MDGEEGEYVQEEADESSENSEDSEDSEEEEGGGDSTFVCTVSTCSYPWQYISIKPMWATL